MTSKRVSFHTLGCKLNFSETSTLARIFAEGGFERAEPGGEADICVINTCSVTGHADKKCRNLIRKLIHDNPGAIIAVTGCYAQLQPLEIAAIEGVDIVVGNDSKGELPRRVAELAADGGKTKKALVHSCDTEELTGFFAAFSSGDRTRAFLKVQDGCDYRCSYCTIPAARGASRNIGIAEAVAQARAIVAAGQKEIVLTGINTGDFGHTTGESFSDLLRALDGVEGVERYRISSIEPNLLTDEIIDICRQSPRFMPHFHIPLQSGSDAVLARMRRRYTTALFADRIGAARRAMPDTFFGIDVITGFPGETDADFDAEYALLESLEPAYLHIFPYSERPGTPAVELPGKVPAKVSAERATRLKELSDRLHRAFAARHEGATAKVLFESTEKGGFMSGFTENYIKVRAPYERSRVNAVCEVRLLRTDDNGIMDGELTAQP